MLNSILKRGLVAGFASGLLAAILHLFFVQPILLKAERYETGELIYRPANAVDEQLVGPLSTASSEASGPLVPAPALDPGRDSLTALFFGLIYGGFGLLLAAGMGWAEARGHAPSLRMGLVWGALGWVAVQLAPAVGLPPGLPGMPGAALAAHQAWWLATVMTTTLGITILAFGRGWSALTAGAAFILSMHVIGAPVPETLTGPVPAELASRFATRVLGVGLIAWAMLGWGVVALRSEADSDARRYTI